MGLVAVVAIRAFEWHGRQIHHGESVSMEAIEAMVQARRRNVTLDRWARPTYDTRDMVAAVPVATVAVVIEDTPRPRQRRRRRAKDA